MFQAAAMQLAERGDPRHRCRWKSIIYLDKKMMRGKIELFSGWLGSARSRAIPLLCMS